MNRSPRPSLALTLLALFLMARAQRVRRRPVDDVLTRLLSYRFLPVDCPIDDALMASNRAGALAGRFGLRNSCLTRCLVAGALLSDRGGLALSIGFRPSGSPTPAGHAWLTYGECILESFSGEAQEVALYSVSRQLPVHRHIQQDR